MKTSHFLILLSALSLTACHFGHSGEPHFGAWQVKTANQNGKKLCYAVSSPVADTSNSTGQAKTSEAFLMATRKPAGDAEISTSSGYNYVRGTKVRIVIDGNSYKLYPKGSMAWAHDHTVDSTIINALYSASDVSVKADLKAASSIDRYSPEGFKDAMGQVKALCP